MNMSIEWETSEYNTSYSYYRYDWKMYFAGFMLHVFKISEYEFAWHVIDPVDNQYLIGSHRFSGLPTLESAQRAAMRFLLDSGMLSAHDALELAAALEENES